MNEALLNDLAIKAGMDLRPQWDEERRQMVNRLSPVELQFARLILREVLDVVDSALYNGGDEWNKTVHFVHHDLTEHFEHPR